MSGSYHDLPDDMRLFGPSSSNRLAEHLYRRSDEGEDLNATLLTVNRLLNERSQATQVSNPEAVRTPSDPDPINPRVVICDECGRKQHMEENECRCGAFLRGQVLNAYSRWVFEKDAFLANRAERYQLLATVGFSISFAPMMFILSFGNTNLFFDLFMAAAKPLSVVAPSILIVGFIPSALVRQEADACQKQRQRLSFEYYVQTQFPHQTPRSYRERKSLRRLLAG